MLKYLAYLRLPLGGVCVFCVITLGALLTFAQQSSCHAQEALPYVYTGEKANSSYAKNLRKDMLMANSDVVPPPHGVGFSNETLPSNNGTPVNNVMCTYAATAGNGATPENIVIPSDNGVPSDSVMPSDDAVPSDNAVPSDSVTPRDDAVPANDITPTDSGLFNSGTCNDSSEQVSYELMVVAKNTNVMLAMYNTLSDPVDAESFAALARHCYDEVGGKHYEKVLINWYLPGQKKGEKPWAVSNFTKDQEVVEILDEELVRKFQSVKRWQQPGHSPLGSTP